MKNKKCNKIIEKYLQLDKNQRLPLAITLHILSCKSCKNKIRMMSLAEESIKEPISIAVPITDNSIEQIMQKISPESYNKITKNPISMTNWIISGIITIYLYINKRNCNYHILLCLCNKQYRFFYKEDFFY